MCKRKLYTLSWILWTFLLLLLISISGGGSSADDNIVKGNERILSRQRRYLIFPEGSSLQLIYDQVLTIVDYTDTYVTGETVALAWELPSQPTYIDDELMSQYKNGTLPLVPPIFVPRNDNENTTNSTYLIDKNTNYVDYNPNRRYDNNYVDQRTNRYHVYNSNNYDSYYKRIPDSYYFKNNNNNYYNRKYYNNNNNNNYNRKYYNNNNKYHHHHHHRGYYRKMQPSKETSNKMNYYFNRYRYNNNINSHYDYDKLKDHQRYSAEHKYQTTTTPIKKTDSKNNINRQRFTYKRKKLRVYPILVKRNADNYRLNYEDKFYINHHRNTRQTLYKTIELYLNAKGKNGTECLLKTLCETGQRRNENEPGSFIAEIIRVIFTLPFPIDNKNNTNEKHKLYDEAHTAKHNCTELFRNCKESVWYSHLII